MKKKLLIIGCLLLTTATFSIVKKDPTGRVLIYSKQPTQGVTIYTNDSVGIGTNSPNAKLQITGNAQTQPIFKIGSGVASGNLLEARGNSAADYAMVITTSGNVGINTPTPSTTLEVRGTINITVGGLTLPDGTTIKNKQMHMGSVYRWTVFSSYDQQSGYAANNETDTFGGVAPSTWGNGNARPYQILSSFDYLRDMFPRKGYGGKNAMVVADFWQSYSSTNGKTAFALFRIKNTTGSAINWTVNWYRSAYSGWGSCAGISINGADTWNGCSTYYFTSKGNNVLSIPPNQTSTIIFQAGSGPQGGTTYEYARPLILGFVDNCLVLPAGLEYVDDLDTVQGNWK